MQIEAAYTNGPGTRFAFKSLLGGVYPLQIDGVGLPERDGTTLAETLSTAGYETAGFVNNGFLSEDFNYGRGFDTFRDTGYWNQSAGELQQGLSKVKRRLRKWAKHSAVIDDERFARIRELYGRLMTTASSSGIDIGVTDETVVAEAKEWIAAREREDEDYFAWIHLMDAHTPYQKLPQHFNAMSLETPPEHVRNPNHLVAAGDPAPQNVLDIYDSCIRETDWQVARLLETAGAETSVVVTADHGEEFGEHRPFHKESPYESMARVPAVLSGPISERVSGRVSAHTDIATTIADFAGEDCPSEWPGRSLIGESSDEGVDVFIGYENENGVMCALVRDEWKLVTTRPDLDSPAERTFLLNIERDPDEQTHFEDDDKRETLETRLKEVVDWTCSRRMRSENPVWDTEQNMDELGQNISRNVEEQLEHLGYK